MLIQFDIALANTLCVFICDFGHYLTRLVHEVVLNQPLTYELLRELLLRFTLSQLLLIAVSIEVA